MKRLLAGLALLALTAFPAAAANFCYVTEFADAAQPVVRTPPLVDQTAVSVSAVTAQSAAFGTDTKLIRISCDTTVSAAFGTNPTATVNNMRLPANVPEYFYIRVGDKVAFITNQ